MDEVTSTRHVIKIVDFKVEVAAAVVVVTVVKWCEGKVVWRGGDEAVEEVAAGQKLAKSWCQKNRKGGDWCWYTTAKPWWLWRWWRRRCGDGDDDGVAVVAVEMKVEVAAAVVVVTLVKWCEGGVVWRCGDEAAEELAAESRRLAGISSQVGAGKMGGEEMYVLVANDDGVRGDGSGSEMTKGRWASSGGETTMVVDRWWSVAWDSVGVAERRQVAKT
ncbi:hypothetical protein Tco_0421723 [Tanacetum coccineum]